MKKQSGFSALEGLLILVIVGIIGFTGWYVWHSKENANKNLNSAAASASSIPSYKKNSTATAPNTSTSASASTSKSSSTNTVGNSTKPSTNNGIEGYVYQRSCAGPAACSTHPYSPYQATVAVHSSSNTPVTSFTSDSSGYFKLALSPGTYILVPQTYNGGQTTAPSQTITVASGSYTSVTIYYESVYP